MATTETGDLIGRIIAFETGELEPAGVLELFAELIGSGAAWSLQGSYGRAAASLIDQGLVTADGEITEAGRDLVS
jgi:hypothetical protein